MAKRSSGWHPQAFREMALERLRTCMHIGTLCEELGISPSTLKRWRLQMESRREADPVLVTATSGCGAASMRFSRHGEIYRWDGETYPIRSPAHPIDESPAGYSLAG